MPATHARSKSGDEVLIAEYGIERDDPTRRLDLAHAPIDGTGDMRKEPGLAERIEIQHRGDRIAEFLELLVEPLALALAIAVTRYIGDKRIAQIALQGRHAAAGNAQYGCALEVLAGLGIVQGRLVIEHRAHRVGKDPLRIVTARVAHQIKLIGEAFIEAGKGAIGQRPMR